MHRWIFSALVGACCLFNLANASSGDVFPFEAEFDAAAGETNGLPNRVVDKVTQMGYLLVPGGTFNIGNDDLPDSKEIKVQLSSFYIGERQVSVADVGKLIRAQFGSNFNLDRIDESTSDEHLLAVNDRIRVVRFTWASELRFSESVEASLIEFRASRAPDAKESSAPLSASDRTALRIVADEVARKLLELEQQTAAPMDRMSNFKAAEYCASRNIRMPTEAEWEVARRFFSDRNPPALDGAADGILEWCSDFYDYDYFQREGDFENPTGPKRGKLSKQQLQAEVGDSATIWMARLSARNLHVMRDGAPSQRQFGGVPLIPNEDHSVRPRGLRPAFSAPSADAVSETGKLTGRAEISR